MKSNCFSFTQHALEMYMERSGAKKILRCLNKIDSMAASAIKISDNTYYAFGWIMIVRNSEIITMYKPRKKKHFNQIYNALNKNEINR